MIKTRLTDMNGKGEIKEFDTAVQVYEYMRKLGLSVTENEKAVYKDFSDNWEIFFPNEYKKLCVTRLQEVE